ncbi:TPA: nucleoside triphosphate pyrophosphohydrolase family protein [Vibrio cholerae]|uniref:SAM-dependent methyltransferase n=1 Tax=Vibrio cholerae TaxID=666 RepID=A0A085T8M0_VIBCL|nr:nucleoside triphosphate pyrophosphohydrolase family protein [Vibrio cholerae]EGQ9105065.1 SAM-dependent methyltransferase [Vibrio cholerae]EGQ9845815.1 SAM-dependent methyltransferase [Vibrio cholerae]EGR1039047.1 SAM-dependent methyltransferase [Vibrio cholerae]EGR1092189.1 SAM-dependent methyltransferase [Vibrio cholerae]EGR2447487.1 SAM-dependent methyltransferase [Vibrio cholerae]
MQLTKLTQEIFDHLYRDISEFRQTFDLPVAAPQTLNTKADTLHTSLAIEELTELAQADNKTEQADAIVDTVYVLMGRLVHLGHAKVEDNLAISYLIDLLLHVAANLNIDFLPCWDEVHSSNMSKVCRSEQEYLDTEKFYAEQGVKLMAVHQGEYIIAKCAEDFISESKTVRQGKVLKSVYYRPANLAALTQ